MSKEPVMHSTFVIERHYPKTPQQVFAAFSDPARKRRWFAEGENFEIEEFRMDFRVGGSEYARFRGKNGMTFVNNTVYQDIVEDRRVVIAYTMGAGEQRISASLATFEFRAAAQGTDLVFTEQAAFFEGADGPKMRQEGWTQLLNRLGERLSG